MKEQRKPVLADHVKVKRKLISPFMAALSENYAPYSWTKQLVPEAIWLALVIDQHGFETASRCCIELVDAVTNIVSREDIPMFTSLSSFTTLTKDQKKAVAGAIDPAVAKLLCTAITPLSLLISRHPLSFLTTDRLPDHDQDRFVRVLDEIYDRNSRLAVLSMALAYRLNIRHGKVHVAPHLIEDLKQSFATISDYPETEAARVAAGRFRAAAPMVFKSIDSERKAFEKDHSWVNAFWERVAGFGACAFPKTLNDEPLNNANDIESFVVGFRNAAKADLNARLAKWTLNLNEIEAYEVVGTLLARQTTLALDLAGAPALWSPHSAPILLRAMADVFITLAWILKSPNERSEIFINDGLGAVKLMIAHQHRAIAAASDPEEIDQMQQMLDIWESWIAGQKLDVFIEVNLGSWSGMSTRRMAEEAGFLDFYNYVYQPFSSAAHSNWFHVSTFNATYCENPAHRGHRVPAIAPFHPDPHWLYLAAKYLRKTLAHFDEVNGFVEMEHKSYDYFFESVTS